MDIDLDISKLIEIVGNLQAQSIDLQRQVDTLAKQNMKQVRAMRTAKSTLNSVKSDLENDMVVFMNPDSRGYSSPEVLSDSEYERRLTAYVKLSIKKLDDATTGTL